jgi:glycosyltransferase involved in cell wall biosynthesis
MKILVITSVFPNHKQPALGIFVRERMFKAARHCEIKVIAPVPWFPFARYLKKDYRPIVGYKEIQDSIEVYHPRFFSIPYFFKFLDGLFFFLSCIITVIKLKKSFKYDIIDSHFVYPDGFGAVLIGKLFHKPVTITLRGTIKKLLRYSLIMFQIRYALKEAAKVFAVCNDLKSVAISLGVTDEKVEVIPNGIDIEKFKPVDKLEARKELGLPADRKIMISVGGLVKRKGFHDVFDVLPEIKKNYPDIMYLIVGGATVEGNYGPELRKAVRSLHLGNEVLFAGHQPHDKIYKWLSASDIFCLATGNEGWANVFLEANACGLPVVTTNVGGNREVVSSEDYGLLFDINNKKEMAAVILKALGKSWDKDKIISYARSNTWDNRITQLLDQFKKIIHSDRLCLSEKVIIR